MLGDILLPHIPGLTIDSLVSCDPGVGLNASLHLYHRLLQMQNAGSHGYSLFHSVVHSLVQHMVLSRTLSRSEFVRVRVIALGSVVDLNKRNGLATKLGAREVSRTETRMRRLYMCFCISAGTLPFHTVTLSTTSSKGQGKKACLNGLLKELK
jgi:hypothetical protein